MLDVCSFEAYEGFVFELTACADNFEYGANWVLVDVRPPFDLAHYLKIVYLGVFIVVIADEVPVRLVDVLRFDA